jgi:hypothetical protein
VSRAGVRRNCPNAPRGAPWGTLVVDARGQSGPETASLFLSLSTVGKPRERKPASGWIPIVAPSLRGWIHGA